MSTIASTLTPLIESHVFNVCQSSSQKSKYPSYAIDLKVLLSDLCYVFFNNNKGAAIDRTYVVKFLQKNHHDYTHNTYIIISFLMKLIECEKNMPGVNHKHSEAKLINIITDVIKAHISFSTKDYYRDELTGLYSFNYLTQFEEQLDIGKTLSVVMIDLDDLKKINDTYGHSFGNKIIKEFSTAILESIRQDDVCIRFGGDEFLVIFSGEQSISTDLFFARLNDNNRINEFNINYSTGIDSGLVGQRTLQDMIEIADFRMYQEKKANKTRRATQNS